MVAPEEASCTQDEQEGQYREASLEEAVMTWGSQVAPILGTAD